MAVTDDFNRAGPALGANWTAIPGFQDVVIEASTTIRPSVGSVENFAIYTNATFANDQYAQVIITNLTVAVSIVGIVLRGSTVDRTHYECRVQGPFGSALTIRIYRYNSGTLTDLANTAADQTVADNDLFKATVVGTTITVYINGVSRLSYNDSAAPITSGKPGVFLLDNNIVTGTQADDFEAGDFSATALRPQSCF